MPNSSNTPSHNTRSTRSNSQNDVTLDNIKILIENSKAEYLDCVKKAVRDEMKSIREDMLVLSSRVDQLENDNRILLGAYQELKKQTLTCRPMNDDQMESIVHEIEQRYSRRENVIVRGLPELDTGSPSQRNAADLGKAHDIFSAMGIDKPVIRDATRLGKITRDRPRLLKIRCVDVDSQKEVLKRSRTLKNVDEYRNVYINKDLTVDEQKRQTLLRGELIRRRNEGENVGIRYGKVVHLGTDGRQTFSHDENFRQ